MVGLFNFMPKGVVVLTLQEILGGGGLALVVVLSLIEVSPVKLNPWGWLAKRIGRAINGELNDKIDGLVKDVKKLREECDEREARAARVRILRFGDEIYQGMKHSKEHFDQILEDISEYDAYCATHQDFKNEMTVLTVAEIKRTYQCCMKEHKFL